MEQGHEHLYEYDEALESFPGNIFTEITGLLGSRNSTGPFENLSPSVNAFDGLDPIFDLPDFGHVIPNLSEPLATTAIDSLAQTNQSSLFREDLSASRDAFDGFDPFLGLSGFGHTFLDSSEPSATAAIDSLGQAKQSSIFKEDVPTSYNAFDSSDPFFDLSDFGHAVLNSSEPLAIPVIDSLAQVEHPLTFRQDSSVENIGPTSTTAPSGIIPTSFDQLQRSDVLNLAISNEIVDLDDSVMSFIEVILSVRSDRASLPNPTTREFPETLSTPGRQPQVESSNSICRRELPPLRPRPLAGSRNVDLRVTGSPINSSSLIDESPRATDAAFEISKRRKRSQSPLMLRSGVPAAHLCVFSWTQQAEGVTKEGPPSKRRCKSVKACLRCQFQNIKVIYLSLTVRSF